MFEERNPRYVLRHGMQRVEGITLSEGKYVCDMRRGYIKFSIAHLYVS